MKDFLIFALLIAVLMLVLGVYCIAFGSNLEAKLIAGFPLILSGSMFALAYICREDFKSNIR